MPFDLLKSDLVYHGRAFDVRLDQVRLPDGGATSLDIVEHNPAVLLVPLEADGSLWLVRQYRHAAGEDLLEFPAGSLEPGEDPAEGAQRELREETGLRADELVDLGGFYLAPGYSTEYIHVFLARRLAADPLPGDDDEWMEVEKRSLPALLAMAQKGEFRDAKSLAALQLAAPYLVPDRGLVQAGD